MVQNKKIYMAELGLKIALGVPKGTSCLPAPASTSKYFFDFSWVKNCMIWAFTSKCPFQTPFYTRDGTAQVGRTPGVRTNVGCCGKNAVKFLGRWLLKRLRKTMLELGGFDLNFVQAFVLKFEAFMLKLGPIQTSFRLFLGHQN
jgi:hypothetical protein